MKERTKCSILQLPRKSSSISNIQGRPDERSSMPQGCSYLTSWGCCGQKNGRCRHTPAVGPGKRRERNVIRRNQKKIALAGCRIQRFSFGRSLIFLLPNILIGTRIGIFRNDRPNIAPTGATCMVISDRPPLEVVELDCWVQAWREPRAGTFWV